MKDEEIKNGIKEIKRIKMTDEEKNKILFNILDFDALKEEPIKSPYLFKSFFQKRHFAYSLVIFLLLIAFGGSGIINYSKNKNGNQISTLGDIKEQKDSTSSLDIENSKIARIDNNKINSLSKEKSISENSYIPQDAEKEPPLSSSTTSTMAPSLLSAKEENKKTYQGNYFSFDYNANAEINSGIISGYGYYVELKEADKFNSIHFYFNDLPDNFRYEFFTDTVVINGKTFLVGDVQTENGIERSYMYTKGEKTIIIQNDYLIDLNSIEIK